MNHFANACGVHYERFSRLHNWLGAVVTVEAILHTVLAVNQGDYDGPANHVVEILVRFPPSAGMPLTFIRLYRLLGQ